MSDKELERANELRTKIDEANEFIDNTIRRLGRVRLRSVRSRIFASTTNYYDYPEYELPKEVSFMVLELLCKQVKEWEKELADM